MLSSVPYKERRMDTPRQKETIETRNTVRYAAAEKPELLALLVRIIIGVVIQYAKSKSSAMSRVLKNR
jgi:hypothetical protein